MAPNSPDIAGATPPNEEDNIEKSVPQTEQVEFSMTGKLLDENAKAATALEHSHDPVGGN
jgi:hypothetical protein